MKAATWMCLWGQFAQVTMLHGCCLCLYLNLPHVLGVPAVPCRYLNPLLSAYDQQLASLQEQLGAKAATLASLQQQVRRQHWPTRHRRGTAAACGTSRMAVLDTDLLWQDMYEQQLHVCAMPMDSSAGCAHPWWLVGAP